MGLLESSLRLSTLCGREMKISVKNTDGVVTSVEVPSDSTVENLKAALAEKLMIHPRCLVLIFNGYILFDLKTVSSYGIEEESTVYMVIKKRKPKPVSRQIHQMLGAHNATPPKLRQADLYLDSIESQKGGYIALKKQFMELISSEEGPPIEQVTILNEPQSKPSDQPLPPPVSINHRSAFIILRDIFKGYGCVNDNLILSAVYQSNGNIELAMRLLLKSIHRT